VGVWLAAQQREIPSVRSIGPPPTLLALTIQKEVVAIEIVWMVQTWLIIVSSMHCSCGTQLVCCCMLHHQPPAKSLPACSGVILHLLIHDLSVLWMVHDTCWTYTRFNCNMESQYNDVVPGCFSFTYRYLENFQSSSTSHLGLYSVLNKQRNKPVYIIDCYCSEIDQITVMKLFAVRRENTYTHT